MRGRTRGSGDGEEKRLMKKEDFREKTAFSIYIVCLIKILDSGKGAEHMSEHRNLFFVMYFFVYSYFVWAIYKSSLLFFFLVSMETYCGRTTFEGRH